MTRDPLRAVARYVRAAVWVMVWSVWIANLSMGVAAGMWPPWWFMVVGAALTALALALVEWAARQHTRRSTDTLIADIQSGPPPPVGVRAIMPDGRTVPLECVYHGRNRDGLAMWHARLAEPVSDPRDVRLSADLLPPETCVALVVYERPAE